MDKIDFCFCAYACAPVLPELKLLVKSIRLFVGETPVLVICDQPVADAMKNEKNVTCFPTVASFVKEQMGPRKTWICRKGLEIAKCAHYVDCDVIFLDGWQPARGPHPVQLSPHFCRKGIEDIYGKYNAGYFVVSGPEFLDWWDKRPQWQNGANDGDQKCLDNWPDGNSWKLCEQHNIGWWRHLCAPRADSFNLNAMGGELIYNGAPAISVHTHILKLNGPAPMNAGCCTAFNGVLLDVLNQSTNPKHKEILAMINGEQPVTLKQPEFGISPVPVDQHPHFKNWMTWLGKFQDKPVIGMEIGVFGGVASRWFLEGILTHAEARFIAVDTFEGGEDHKQDNIDCSGLYDTFMRNIEPFKSKVTVLKGRSSDMLRANITQLHGVVSFIYLDGSHLTADVLDDALRCWDCLAAGGVMIFDDYDWAYNSYKGDPGKKQLHTPRLAIDSFLACFEGHYRLLYKGYQVCVEKS